MSYIVQSNSRLQFPGELNSSTFLVINDATAQPTTNVTGSAAATQLATVDNTGWTPTEVIQIPGGTAGALEWYQIRTCGVPIGSDNLTRVDIRPNKALVVAVTSVATAPYFKVRTRTIPSSVTMTNISTAQTWKWQRGMNQNTAIFTAASGATSVLLNSGIVCFPNCINFHPGFLGVNESMTIQVQYENS